MWNCKHCKNVFDFNTASEKANHSRWCTSNPKRTDYVNSVSKNSVFAMNIARIKSGNTNQYTKAKNFGLEKPILSEESRNRIRSKNLGRKHSEESKKLISEKALASPHRRLKKNTINYINKNNEEILLDSTWEYYLASKLDDLDIRWIRPNPIKWKDKNNKLRNYFPDFYLLDHDLYLDPKNPAAYNSQLEKIECLLTQMNNLVILKSIDDINKFLAGVSPQSSKLMKG